MHLGGIITGRFGDIPGLLWALRGYTHTPARPGLNIESLVISHFALFYIPFHNLMGGNILWFSGTLYASYNFIKNAIHKSGSLRNSVNLAEYAATLSGFACINLQCYLFYTCGTNVA